ncbi:MAG TPA: rRNA maturation RNase YbeY [Bacillus sp. (in: firmicutes)]|uniref:rRNA maturation RNase YbeY n=1 Tax=Bacillus litorisediminis TaxID=2922713 RepID=UPI001FABF182|nr:rRNA maturation RNase YbeY [Bacillus litorisediminis]HWO77684.1 rRNA maturation RNase YbeY [Bacillus sp. (in: firmicutes)]
MNLEIDFLDETNTVTEKEEKLIRDLITIGLKQEKVEEDCEISVTFVSNDKIQEINREYRGKDKPTDVISFALEEGDEEEVIIGAPETRVLGDIIISIEKTKEQAEEYGHSFERELGFLAVHGLLHLLGYDHETEQEEKEMFSKQESILEEYGLKR